MLVISEAIALQLASFNAVIEYVVAVVGVTERVYVFVVIPDIVTGVVPSV